MRALVKKQNQSNNDSKWGFKDNIHIFEKSKN